MVQGMMFDAVLISTLAAAPSFPEVPWQKLSDSSKKLLNREASRKQIPISISKTNSRVISPKGSSGSIFTRPRCGRFSRCRTCWQWMNCFATRSRRPSGSTFRPSCRSIGATACTWGWTNSPMPWISMGSWRGSSIPQAAETLNSGSGGRSQKFSKIQIDDSAFFGNLIAVLDLTYDFSKNKPNNP